MYDSNSTIDSLHAIDDLHDFIIQKFRTLLPSLAPGLGRALILAKRIRPLGTRGRAAVVHCVVPTSEYSRRNASSSRAHRIVCRRSLRAAIDQVREILRDVALRLLPVT